jgi:hypothetical protein
MAKKRGVYQRRPMRPVSQQGKPAVKQLGEDSFETRDLESMRGGAWNKRDSSPSLMKKKAQTKPNKLSSPGAYLPAGGNQVK